MGGGVSTSKYADSKAQSVEDTSAAVIGQRVHIVGLVAHTGSALSSPFAEDTGVAIAVQWRMEGRTDKLMFTAEDVVSFKLISGSKEVAVAAGSNNWKLDLRETHKVCNIMKGGGGLMSTPVHGAKKQFALRPLAMPFFNSFGEKDRLPIQSSSDRPGQQAQCRRAHESVLKIGERAAVCGTLRQGADGGLYLEPAGAAGGLISNKPALLAKSIELRPGATEASAPELGPMSKK